MNKVGVSEVSGAICEGVFQGFGEYVKITRWIGEKALHREVLKDLERLEYCDPARRRRRHQEDIVTLPTGVEGGALFGSVVGEILEGQDPTVATDGFDDIFGDPTAIKHIGALFCDGGQCFGEVRSFEVFALFEGFAACGIDQIELGPTAELCAVGSEATREVGPDQETMFGEMDGGCQDLCEREFPPQTNGICTTCDFTGNTDSKATFAACM